MSIGRALLALACLVGASSAHATTCVTHTTQADFAAGVINGVDLEGSPGDVILAEAAPGAFVAGGDYLSPVRSVFPGDGMVTSWPSLSWNATTPPGTSVRFQITTETSPGPNDFAGPDGTSATYFTTPDVSLERFNGNWHLRYKVYLSSNDPAVTPTLHDVTLCSNITTPPDVAVNLGTDVPSVGPNQDFLYTVTYRNQSEAGATDLSVEFQLPNETKLLSTDATPGLSCTTFAVTNCVAYFDQLAGHTTRSITVLARTKSSVPAGTPTLIGTARIYRSGPGQDPADANNTARIALPFNGAPNLLLTVTRNGSGTPGRTVTYTINVFNHGSRGASGVFLRTLVPEHTVFNPAESPGNWTCVPDGNPGSACTRDTVGQSARFGLTIDPDIDTSVTQIVSTTSVGDDGSNGPDSAPENNQATDVLTLLPWADTSITMTPSTAPAIAGAVLHFNIVVANAGPFTPSGAQWTTFFPQELSFLSLNTNDPQWNCQSSPVGLSVSVNCLRNAFATGSSTFDLAVKVKSSLPPNTVLNARVIARSLGDINEVDDNNNSVSIDTLIDTQADLSLQNSASATAVPAGTNVSHTLTLNNAGPSDATSVLLSDVLPSAASFVSMAAPSGWSCATPAIGATGTVSCARERIDATPAIFVLTTRIDANVPGGTVLTHNATVSANTADGNTTNNVAVATTLVSGPPTLTAQPQVEMLEDRASAALAITIDDAETAAESLTLVATSNNQNLVTNASLAAGLSGRGADRALVITPRANAHGALTIMLSVVDDAGNLTRRPVAVNIAAVNDAPSANYAGSRVHAAGSNGARTVTNYASAISAGPADEAMQSVSFQLDEEMDSNDVVADASMDASGALHYLLSGHSGSATYSVIARDDGGTANGGLDRSAPQVLKFIVGDGVDISTRIERLSPLYLPLTHPANGGATIASYAVTVTNHGATPVNGITLQVPTPSGLTAVSWTCATSAGTCANPQGSGGASTSFNLAVGDVATLRLSGTIDVGQAAVRVSGIATLPANITALSTSDDSAEVIEPITSPTWFGDGFE